MNVAREQSAGAIIFWRAALDQAPLFLVVKDAAHGNWGFPKGHIESGEDTRNAARREIAEETGLSDLRFIDGFQEKITYPLSQGTEKEVTYFLAESPQRDVTYSDGEIVDHAWLLTYEAIGRVTFVDTALLVDKARNFLLRLEERERQG